MEVVDVWTGSRASALQRALRLTNERFARKLGTAVRTVAKWNANPDIEPTAEMQEALDTVHRNAPDDAKARFSMLVGTPAATTSLAELAAVQAAEQQLASNPHMMTASGWLDAAAGWNPGTARRRAAVELARIDPMWLHDRGHRRARVDQRDIAAALVSYYSNAQRQYGTYGARFGAPEPANTSILTCPDWLDLACPLNESRDRIRLDTRPSATGAGIDSRIIDGSVRRIAESFAADNRIVDSPLYRLTDIAVKPGHLGGTFGLTTFVEYALTMDLLESELIDALADGKAVRPGTLPFRDALLPDLASVVEVGRRVCSGGALALCAIARPAAGSRRPADDYLLLVQERSGRVLNASRRLAVIPKSFHEPLSDYEEDARIGATLRREMEEELFGRDDVDGTIGEVKHADPMHVSRLSEPMGWLVGHDDTEHWRMECTGFGLNLVSGNCEFAGLIVIDDPEFWTRLRRAHRGKLGVRRTPSVFDPRPQRIGRLDRRPRMEQ